MITVKIPLDKNFDFKTCKKLYRKYRKLIKDDKDFRGIVENTFFYSFYNDEDFIGCLYFYEHEGKLFVNAFANRHKSTLECLKMSLNWFNCDIYANTTQKSAIYGILKCGFKKVGNNLYIFKRR